MCTPRRLFLVVLAALITACGGELTLPDDGSPAALRVFSGDRQEGTVGSRLNDPLVVELTDASARPIPGQAVVFEFTSNVPGAELTPEAAMTDSSGHAAAEVRLGTSTGGLQVNARLATAASLNATFLLTALEKKKNKPGRGGGGGNEDD
ncbi:MAG: hypothetical protein ABI785_11400 [Gemmatimonadales bacterium]